MTLGTKKWKLLYNALKKNWKSSRGIAFVLFLLDQVLSDTNISLEDAVCFLPTNTSDLPENYHDEIASDYCDIFDEEEEDADEATHQCLTDQCMNQHQEKALCWNLIKKENLYAL